MRAIVFSDSHGHLDHAVRSLKEAGPVDLIIHAGDFYRDAAILAAETNLPVRAVMGNCDLYDEGPQELVLELAGHRILLVHGNAFASKHRFGKLALQAAGIGADTVVFGHSHAAGFIREDGVLLFNPGSIARPRDHDQPSYGILEIDENGVRPAIRRI
ncbi:MAG: metallophosphoesterase [Desulfotomaculaceae bacterium]|nr:metallophosphoesterase [Desulfotomaculaceae bacterium]